MKGWESLDLRSHEFGLILYPGRSFHSFRFKLCDGHRRARFYEYWKKSRLDVHWENGWQVSYVKYLLCHISFLNHSKLELLCVKFAHEILKLFIFTSSLGIVFPDPEICDAFVQCQRGAPIPQRCQAGTVFDLRLYYCVAAHTVECGSRRQPNSRIIPPNSIDAPTAESHHSVSR